jgi:hypothetical protein
LDWEQLYSDADDFCRVFEPAWERQQVEAGIKHRVRPSALTLSEVMTIIIAFHQSRFRDFKHFYLDFVCRYHRDAFPNLVSYSRFVEPMPSALVPLCAFLHTRCGRVTGIAYIDSTRLEVCHPKRAHAHRVFGKRAKWGKTSVGWFYGFKLHLVVNDEGELLAFKLTAGNVDDRVPVPVLTRGLFGKLFGDKGYISQKLFDELYEKGVELITRLRKKMKNKLMRLADKLLLRKRALIESVNDQRSPVNFLVNLVAGLIAYTYQPKKPSLNLRPDELAQLPVLV